MRKRNTKQAKQVKQVTKAMKKATPFGDVGGIVGRAAGNLFGRANIGNSVGRWLGSGIGSIFGSGEYTMVGQQPHYNVLTNSNQIPKFSSDGQANIVTHREYLGDISGTSTFTNNAYPLNPGMSKTFPWLSTVAGCYQEYKWHGLIFEFRPLTTDFANAGVPGVVIMSTNYNADAPLYLSKQQMENAEFAVSTKPTLSCIHGIECDPTLNVLGAKYVRDSLPPSGQDLRLYDHGNFQFATQNNNPLIVLGELWVSYCVELMKPILPGTIGGGNISHFARSNTVGTTALGTIAVRVPVNELDLVVTSNTITFPNALTGTYTITIVHVGTAAIFSGFVIGSITNGADVPGIYDGATQAFGQAPSGISTPNVMYQTNIRLTPNNVSTVVTFNAGVFPANSDIDIIVTTASSGLA